MFKSNPRRALVVEPSGNLWGSERVLLDFLGVASKAESGWHIGVCCPPNTPIIEQLCTLPVEVVPVFQANLHLLGRAQRLRATLALWRAARGFRPDLIYVNQAGATRIALAVGRLIGVPVITHVRLAEDVAYVASLGASAKALPKVICISHVIRREFEGQKAVSLEQLEMIYDPYTMHAQEKTTALDFDFQLGEPVWSCVGRLAHIKGQDVLLQALAVLQSVGVSSRALFVGAAGPRDDFDGELKRLSHELNIEEQVTWAGFQGEALSHLKRCAAQVCPSRGEPLGRVVFEAWDAGTLPVAWKGSGGPAEVIEQSGGGLLYAEQNGESLAATLQTVLAMKSENKTAMIEAGRVWLRANCDPATYTRQMLDWWQEVGQPR